MLGQFETKNQRAPFGDCALDIKATLNDESLGGTIRGTTVSKNDMPPSGRTLEVRNLSKRFPGVVAVDDVTFTAHGGEITGYLGPNGSGKSTTMKMIT